MSALLFHMVGGAPDPVAPFSHAVEADGWVFVTGQMPFTGTANDSPYPESIEDQTHQVMKNLRTVLEGCHLALEHVLVHLAVPDDYARLRELFAQPRGLAVDRRDAVVDPEHLALAEELSPA